MLLAGDEFGRTQGGNNNAYCQDNDISWVDWNIDADGTALAEFARRLIGLRQQYPILRRGRFLTAAYNEELGVKDVTWINANGGEMQQADWDDPNVKCFGMLLDGRAQVSGIPKRAQDATLLLVLNGWHDAVKFTLPKAANGRRWTLLADTNQPALAEEPAFAIGAPYEVTGRSFLAFLLQQREARPRRPKAPPA